MNISTPEDVMERLVEAVEVIAVAGKGDGPKTVLAAWPEYRGKTARRCRSFPPSQISRAEEALTWFALVDDLDARRALQFEIMCKAGGGRFSHICEKYGWKRSTVTSRNRVLLTKLAAKLNLAA
ncbi:MAG: DUF6362 family protein [Roseibium sp.]|uniref:DUF6362 family protein n=1 Tax=Roseibium sp. TaxID=1936156 RepID=UPI00262F1554|nr:DUF6362 family protein [Roseibium sp.]MCV0427174.1 DUF6362 family protein [Roseibium sp.]